MNEYMFDLMKRHGVTSGTDVAISTEFFDMKTIGIDSGVTNATAETQEARKSTSNSMISANAILDTEGGEVLFR